MITQAGCLPPELVPLKIPFRTNAYEAHININRRIPSRSISYQLLLSINPALLPSAICLLPDFLHSALILSSPFPLSSSPVPHSIPLSNKISPPNKSDDA